MKKIEDNRDYFYLSLEKSIVETILVIERIMKSIVHVKYLIR